MAAFYRTEKVSSRITRIIDLAGVACYLITGRDRACLLDTCCGYGDIRACAQSLTDKPIFVVLTHGHYDHTGGADFYEEVYMNPADQPVLKKHAQERRVFWEIDRKNLPALELPERFSLCRFQGFFLKSSHNFSDAFTISATCSPGMAK